MEMLSKRVRAADIIAMGVMRDRIQNNYAQSYEIYMIYKIINIY